nr:MAG: maturation protein [Leviviridae sp.]
MSRRQNFNHSFGSAWTQTINGNLVSSGSVPNARNVQETYSGVTRRKPTGWIPPTPYSFSRVAYKLAEGSSEYKRSDGRITRYVGCVGGAPGNNSLNTFNELLILTDVPQSMQDRAVVKARLAMKDQSVNLGVAFAERNKTAQLVGDTSVQLAKAMMALRRRDWKQAARELGLNNPREPRGKSVVNRWLELQYGWKPLLSDVYGSVDALSRRPPSDWMVTGKGSDSDKTTSSKEVGGSAWSRSNGYLTVEKGCFVRIDASPTNDPLLIAASLGITNPAVIAWELVPFSFVVDWMLPIGSYLDSLDAMLGYGPTWCSISRLRKASWEIKGRSGADAGGVWTMSSQGWKEEIHLSRIVSTSVPLPVLPRFKDPVSFAHMANGLSLLASAFSGRR